MDSFEYTGLWWLPSNSNEAVGGTVSFTPEDGIKLSIIGTLGTENSVEDFLAIEPRSFPIILGVASNGKSITLTACTIISSKFNTNGIATQVIRCVVGYIGSHFHSDDELHFNRFALSYSYLGSWYGRTGLVWDTELGDQGERSKIRLEYIQPEDAVAQFENVILKVTTSVSTNSEVFSASISQSSLISVDIPDALPFNEVMREYAIPLQNLLTLATGRPNAITMCKVYPALLSAAEETVIARKSMVDVVFSPQYYHQAQDKDKTINPGDLLFNLNDVKRFDQLIQNWLGSYKDLAHVFNIFFSAQYNPSKYLEVRFLSILQALEVYHGIRYDNNDVLLRNEELRSILSHLSDEDREWLQVQANINTRPRTFKRVLELLDFAGNILTPLTKDNSEFARKVESTKKYFTNYEDAYRSSAVQGVGLHWVSETLNLLLQVCFLHELGFSPQQRVNLFERYQRYQNALRFIQGV